MQRLKRDRHDEVQLKAGKSLGYHRTAKQADSAAANVNNSAAPRETPRSRGSSKGRDKNEEKSKGRGKACKVFAETGACSRGKDRWRAKNTPGHP
eukprot:9398020-Pyramimonas_sp.AAC.2